MPHMAAVFDSGPAGAGSPCSPRVVGSENSREAISPAQSQTAVATGVFNELAAHSVAESSAAAD
jgi:hypothetical protein